MPVVIGELFYSTLAFILFVLSLLLLEYFFLIIKTEPIAQRTPIAQNHIKAIKAPRIISPTQGGYPLHLFCDVRAFLFKTKDLARATSPLDKAIGFAVVEREYISARATRICYFFRGLVTCYAPVSRAGLDTNVPLVLQRRYTDPNEGSSLS